MNKEQAAKENNKDLRQSYYYYGTITDTDLDDAFIAGATWQEQQNKCTCVAIEQAENCIKNCGHGSEPEYPHALYMEFAEWYKSQGCDLKKHELIINGELINTTTDLFQYWLTNIKNNG